MKNNCDQVFRVLQQTHVNCVCFRLPRQSTSIWVQKEIKLTEFHSTDQKGFVFAPFNKTSSYPAVLLKPDVCFSLQDWDDSLKIDIQNCEQYSGELPIQKTPSLTQEEYLPRLKHAIDKMQEKGLHKFIFSRIQIKEGDYDVAHIFENLCAKYPNAFVYFIQLPEIGTWMGATPEILSTLDENTFTTFSLAGTQPTQTIDHVYNWEKKERDEQTFVTSYIQKTFETYQIPFDLIGPDTKIAGPVAHLLSTFKANKQAVLPHLNSLLNSLHPTPAVCGIPKQDAQNFIIETETHERAYYTGFLGPITSSEINLYVNLRCMQLFYKKLALYLGGGITLDSVPELEWQETELKATTLLSVIE